MTPSHALPVSPGTPRAGFTLTEVVLALGIIAIAFVGVLGLLPAGLQASRQAANSTVVGAVLEDLHNRLQGQPLIAGPANFSPAYYDDQGAFIDPAASAADLARRLYRADVQIGSWQSQPTGTSALRPVTISLSWPVDRNGNAAGKGNPQSVVTYPATTLSGSNWTAIDPTFVPKLEY
jgi:uncharacterized protein (TIGR02598 family)